MNIAEFTYEIVIELRHSGTIRSVNGNIVDVRIEKIFGKAEIQELLII